MIARECIQSKLTTTVEAGILVAPKKKSILEWWIESVCMNLAVAGHDTGQSQQRLLSATINTPAHLEDGTTERPDDEIFNQQCCCLFPGKPAYRNTRFV